MKTKEQTLRGHVVPTDWDQFDDVIELSIQTEDDDYVIDLSNPYGREMFDFIDQGIELTGIVKQDRHGIKTITVTDFEQLEEEEEDFQFDSDWDTGFGGEEGETTY